MEIGRKMVLEIFKLDDEVTYIGPNPLDPYMETDKHEAQAYLQNNLKSSHYHTISTIKMLRCNFR